MDRAPQAVNLLTLVIATDYVTGAAHQKLDVIWSPASYDQAGEDKFLGNENSASSLELQKAQVNDMSK